MPSSLLAWLTNEMQMDPERQVAGMTYNLLRYADCYSKSPSGCNGIRAFCMEAQDQQI